MKNIAEQHAKRVIIVLGPGRSGTSLLMQALGAMGMRLSEKMIPGSASNPGGFFEDSEIVDVHKELLESLSAHPALPLPDDWLGSGPAQKAKRRLKEILDERMAESETIWGFKDPRTVSFLPLWIRILNEPGVVPVFILAMRNPAHVVTSLHRQINREKAITELQWLQRTIESLHHTAADCCIVHYEDWFTRPVELVQGLLAYTGLDQYCASDASDVVQELIEPSLNRAAYEEYGIQNEYVLKLYDTLSECRGSDFDRTKLMETVGQCQKAMDGFKGWYLQAHKCLAQLKNQRQSPTGREELGKLENQLREMKSLEAGHLNQIKELQDEVEQLWNELEQVTLEENENLKQLKDSREEIERLRRAPVQESPQTAQPDNAHEQAKQVAKLQTRVKELRSSYSFRIGEVFVNAVAYPGKATILLPFRFLKIVLEFLVTRKTT